MEIKNSLLEDLPKIFRLYKIATDYMKSKNQVHWPEFPKELIENEILEKRQWKLVIDDEIACIWAIAMSDPLIWEEKDSDPSLYIHRIATDPSFRGQSLVKKLIDWANEYGKMHGRAFIRMDTVGRNEGLIGHYEKLGFRFLGMKKLVNTEGLPDHYKDDEVCLFEKKIV